ncbi:hypothetical protein ODJ79_24880 [Actinoplanes sp. KI2]|uniref:hypothetical protein n=1 Tax=Actinoplanes sp. KI2 TaxID=2983315 RepID=UPI0021D60581|nr:hypothetical protein [Actinoplanes sp. KI2]MCU7726975.1 hypothetical protein [Actinoplanes sp. KI2]
MNPGVDGGVVRHAARVETDHGGHPASWWQQFQALSAHFDLAIVTEGITDLVIPKIPSPLLRREAELAADLVVRHLAKTASLELAERAEKQLDRLMATLERLAERSTSDDSGIVETNVACQALAGDAAEAAAEAEPMVGTSPLLKVFVSAMRLERFDTSLAVRLLRAGHAPAEAVRAGLIVGKYLWWPTWLLKTVTERALARSLDVETMQALDRSAFAKLTPIQARMARRLLNGEETLIEASARRLEALGEESAAALLREGDLGAIALAARLIPL